MRRSVRQADPDVPRDPGQRWAYCFIGSFLFLAAFALDWILWRFNQMMTLWKTLHWSAKLSSSCYRRLLLAWNIIMHGFWLMQSATHPDWASMATPHPAKPNGTWYRMLIFWNLRYLLKTFSLFLLYPFHFCFFISVRSESERQYR